MFEILYKCLLSPLTLAKLASPSLQSAISGVLVCVFVPINPDSRCVITECVIIHNNVKLAMFNVQIQGLTVMLCVQ